jgi:hypothetical protein
MKGLFTGALRLEERLWRRFSTQGRVGLPRGALCYDYTFKRVLGTPKQSEPILKDLLGAMRFAQTGVEMTVQDVSIVDSKVREGVAPKFKSELLVDVRVKDSDSNFIVEVQRRKEAAFIHRVILYSSADIVSQHVKSMGYSSKLRPVHTLAFCDYDFREGKEGIIGASLTNWRTKKGPYSPEVRKAIQSYALEQQSGMLARLDGIDNNMLSKEMRNRMSFVFALLPHAPRLEDLTANTHPLLRWAALIAHVDPEDIDAVPKEVRDIQAVKLMLDILEGTVSQTKHERELAELEFARDLEEEQEIFEDGKAEGIQRALFQIGVTNAAEYRLKFGSDPPVDVAKALLDIADNSPNAN